MQPFLRGPELDSAQQACKDAFLALRQSTDTSERLRLWRTAWPWGFRLDDMDGTLRTGWSNQHQAWAIFDAGGFLTMVEDDPQLRALIHTESIRMGSLRERLTGEKIHRVRASSERIKLVAKKKVRITLSDLGLG